MTDTEAVNEVHRILTQKDTAIRTAHALAKDWQEVADRQRKELDTLHAYYAAAEEEAGAWREYVERLVEWSNCPNPAALVEHIQGLFEIEQGRASGLERQLAEAHAALAVGEEDIQALIREVQNPSHDHWNDWVARLRAAADKVCL